MIKKRLSSFSKQLAAELFLRIIRYSRSFLWLSLSQSLYFYLISNDGNMPDGKKHLEIYDRMIFLLKYRKEG